MLGRQKQNQAVIPNEMVALIACHQLNQGFTPTAIPHTRFMHSTEYVASSRVAYDPSIVVIAQGRKVGRVGEQTLVYDPNHYLVLSVPLPFECETIATAETPLYGISIGLTPAMIGELILQVDDDPAVRASPSRGAEAACLDAAMSQSVIRLLEALKSPLDSKVLGAACVREVIYRAMLGSLGGNLRALASPDSHYGRICRALHRLQTEFDRPIEIERLARDTGMSPASFHQRFKTITGASPLQYLKAIRLQKARLLMINQGATASAAAQRVGYESASQFNREFKRYFGGTPRAVTDELKKSMVQFA